MEQIIQSIKSQICVFWLGKHINAKNNARLTQLSQGNGVLILNNISSQETENIKLSSNNILLIIEPDFS